MGSPDGKAFQHEAAPKKTERQLRVKRFLHLGTLLFRPNNSLGWGGVGGDPVHCKMFNSAPGLNPLGAGSTHTSLVTTKMSPDS